MPDINTEAETPLYAQAVAAVWLRMLETMHARKREIAAATVQRAAPSEADLADDGIHQARPPATLSRCVTRAASPCASARTLMACGCGGPRLCGRRG